VQELRYSIEHGAVGATCNPMIVLGVLKKEIGAWKDRIVELIEEQATATEDEIAWELVREVSVKAAALLQPIFEKERQVIDSDRPATIPRRPGDCAASSRVQ
jgi:transaldolase